MGWTQVTVELCGEEAPRSDAAPFVRLGEELGDTVPASAGEQR